MVVCTQYLTEQKNDYTYSKLGVELARDRGLEEQSLLVKEHMWRWVSGFKFRRKDSEDTHGTQKENKGSQGTVR